VHTVILHAVLIIFIAVVYMAPHSTVRSQISNLRYHQIQTFKPV
jgi:hypothetical protein